MRAILIALLFTIPFFASAQKLARYTSGSPGEESYYELNFWSNKNITVKQGNNPEEQSVKYMGATFYQMKAGFLVQLPDNKLIRVMPFDDGRISITGLNMSLYKMLNWKHEGPLNSKGICLPCMLNEREAATMLKKTYM